MSGSQPVEEDEMASRTQEQIASAASRIAALRSADIRRGVGAARKHASKAAATATLRDFRTETETALSKLVEVMCAHEAEIADLRRQVAALSDKRQP